MNTTRRTFLSGAAIGTVGTLLPVSVRSAPPSVIVARHVIGHLYSVDHLMARLLKSPGASILTSSEFRRRLRDLRQMQALTRRTSAVHAGAVQLTRRMQHVAVLYELVKGRAPSSIELGAAVQYLSWVTRTDYVNQPRRTSALEITRAWAEVNDNSYLAEAQLNALVSQSLAQQGFTPAATELTAITTAMAAGADLTLTGMGLGTWGVVGLVNALNAGSVALGVSVFATTVGAMAFVSVIGFGMALFGVAVVGYALGVSQYSGHSDPSDPSFTDPSVAGQTPNLSQDVSVSVADPGTTSDPGNDGDPGDAY